MTKRRILRSLRIFELSAVDKPAQEGAKAVIMKREFSQDERDRAASSGAALPDGSFPIKNREDLKNAIQAFGRAKDKAKVARHIARRARALGLTDLLPDSGELADLIRGSKKSASEDTLDTGTPESGTNKSDGMSRDSKGEDTMTDAAEKLAKAEKDLQDKDAEIAVLKALSTMTDAEKDHYSGLGDEDGIAFLKMAPKNRAAEIQKALDANKVVYKDRHGREYRANDNAELVKLAKENDENAAKLNELEKKDAEATFTKRAETELGHMSGETDAKCALLKAVSSIEDEKTREAVEAMLKATDANVAKAMETLGTAIGGKEDEDSPAAKLDGLAKKYQEDHEGTSYEQAYEAVLATEEGRGFYKAIVTN